ncbi:HEAT repeat-containing protein 6 [Nilaparvata lugens]|uniref:HEAT repeat-containing protein 6 n=1 Tax=Nilaparvata lugens TaxID=108931 RepID=UPI00193E069B|nr:HEAT repeat-containing protein 6 [Nilaparvata lugens]
MEKHLDSYMAEFSSLECGRSDSDKPRINHLLDCLNALNFSDCIKYNNNKAVLLIHQCCKLVSPSDTFLVAKCSHLIMNLVTKLSVKIEGKSLCIVVNWCCQALKLSADVALIDVLQALHAVIESKPSSIEEVTQELINRLSEGLEDRANLLIPQNVKFWRIRCMNALIHTGSLNHNQLLAVSEIFLAVLITNTPLMDDLCYSQVLTCSIEAVQGLCDCDKKWLSEHLGDVIGIIMAYMHFGLADWKFKRPKRHFPTPLPVVHNSADVKGPVNHRKQRTKAIRQGLKSNDDETSVVKVDEFDLAELNLTTSDSDFSDNEGGRLAKRARVHSKVRLASLNLLLNLTKVCGCKELFGFYGSLLSSCGLPHSILREPAIRVKSTAIATLSVLLSAAKGFFVYAQETESASFTAFSSVLADLLKSLHECLISAFKQNSPPLIYMNLIHCTSALVGCTPYHRLKPGLASQLHSVVCPFLRFKERNMTVAVLTYIGALVTLNPTTDEICKLISQKEVVQEEISSDIDNKEMNNVNVVLPELCIDFIKDAASPVSVIVESWQLITHLTRNHYGIIATHLEAVLEALHISLVSTSDVVQLHSAKALEQMAPLMANSKETEALCVQEWCHLLRGGGKGGGALLAVLQSAQPIAAAGCDCVANIGAHIYAQLPTELSILVITLLFGCTGHDESGARAAAIRAIAMLLTFAALEDDEQFVSDVSDSVQRLLGDASLAVRVKAAWSLGKLCETIARHTHLRDCVDVHALFQVTLRAASDNDNVRTGAVRALGYLVKLLTEEDVKQPDYVSSIEKTSAALTKAASSGLNMKLKWNACYALSSLFENSAIQSISASSWQDQILTALCNIIMKCNNFKVRVNACHALYSISQRNHFGSHYFTVWQTILDGLENAYNMPDLREFKHQTSLFDQLCLNVCQLTRLATVEDLGRLHDILVFRMEVASEHMHRFQRNALPENTQPVISARSHISSISLPAHTSQAQQSALEMLTNIFAAPS